MHPYLQFNFYSGKGLHIGLTGSIALYKMISVVRHLKELNIIVHATLTASARQFTTPLAFRSIGVDHIYEQLFDDADQFAHLRPGRTCDCQIVAPATANFIAKMAHGIADDMLSCQVLSFKKKQIVAPAMNTNMWTAPATQHNVDTLKSRGVAIIEPDAGTLACGDVGSGKLADERTISLAILQALTPQDLSGKNILVSLGPTHEYFDVARYWTNPSTGLMGACLAIAAWLRGANVAIVHGPISLWLPPGLTAIPIVSARDMYQAMLDMSPAYDFICMTAAVSDFSPVPYSDKTMKFKRDISGLTAPDIAFTPNPDILASLGQSKLAHQKLIGFCAETNDILSHAKEKLHRKNCDMMVANSIATPESGFGSTSNAVLVLDRNGRQEAWPQLPKTEVAWRIWDWAIRN